MRNGSYSRRSEFILNFAHEQLYPKFFIPNLTPPDVTERLLQTLAREARKVLDTNKSERHIRGGISGAGWLRERSIFISMGKTGKWKAEADCTEAVQQLPLF